MFQIAKRLINSHPLIFLLLIQLISWGQIFLFPEGRWWDDWILSSVPSGEYFEILMQQGIPFFAVTYGMMGTWPLAIVTAIGFLAWYVASLCFSKIFLYLGLVSRVQSYIIAALCLSIPLADARVMKCITLFQVTVALFMAGWALFLKKTIRFRKSKMTLAFVLVSLSFSTASLILFSALLVILYFRNKYDQSKSFSKNLIRSAFCTLPVAVLPLFIWILQRNLFPQSGPYSDYNKIGTGFDNPKNIIFIALLIICFVIPLTMLLSVKKYTLVNYSNQVILLLSGSIGITTALLPYALVGKLPVAFSGLDSRYQLLVPFGLSLVLLAILNSVKIRKPHIFELSILTIFAIFMIVSNVQIYNYWLNYSKQEAVLNYLDKHYETLAAANLIIIDDQTKTFPVQGHISYSFYEISGWLETTFGDRTRLGISKDSDYFSSTSDFFDREKLWRLGAADVNQDFTTKTLEISSPGINNLTLIQNFFLRSNLFEVNESTL